MIGYLFKTMINLTILIITTVKIIIDPKRIKLKYLYVFPAILDDILINLPLNLLLNTESNKKGSYSIF